MSEWTPERARSFGRVAAQYERGRPEYPPRAVSWLLEHAPAGRVIDLGAGTGKLTRVLVELDVDVVAIEPLDELRQILDEVVPGVVTVSGSAEEIPAPDDSAAAVVAAQAFHWFTPQRALSEIARVLVPEGVVGVIWNLSDETVPWVREFSTIIGMEGLGWPAGEVGTLAELDDSPLFQQTEFATFRHTHQLSPHALVDHAASVSGVATLPDEERDATLDQVRALLATHPDLKERDPVAFPYVTSAFRARLATGERG